MARSQGSTRARGDYRAAGADAESAPACARGEAEDGSALLVTPRPRQLMSRQVGMLGKRGGGAGQVRTLSGDDEEGHVEALVLGLQFLHGVGHGLVEASLLRVASHVPHLVHQIRLRRHLHAHRREALHDAAEEGIERPRAAVLQVARVAEHEHRPAADRDRLQHLELHAQAAPVTSATPPTARHDRLPSRLPKLNTHHRVTAKWSPPAGGTRQMISQRNRQIHNSCHGGTI